MKEISHNNNEPTFSEAFDQEKFSLREAHSEDDVTEMKKKVDIQLTTMKEFEGYLRTLLSVIHGSGNLDYSEQIQQGLEKLEILIKDNLETKRMILKEYKKKEEISKSIDTLNTEIQKRYEELKTTECGQLIIEKTQLLGSLEKISEEVDKLSETNNNLIRMIKAKETPSEYLKLKEEMRNLKNENLRLKKNLVPKITRKKFDFAADENKKMGDFFSCVTCSGENNITLNFKNNNELN